MERLVRLTVLTLFSIKEGTLRTLWDSSLSPNPQLEVLISVKVTKGPANLSRVILGGDTSRGRIHVATFSAVVHDDSKGDGVATLSVKMVPGILDVTHGSRLLGTLNDNDALSSALLWCWYDQSHFGGYPQGHFVSVPRSTYPNT